MREDVGERAGELQNGWKEEMPDMNGYSNLVASEDVLENIQKHMDALSKGHRQIAAYILDHYDQAAFMTAARLGQEVHISESTVVRFANALGYEGYPELQRALQQEVRAKLTYVQRMQLASHWDESDVLASVFKSDMANIRHTLDHIDTQVFAQAVRLLIQADHIYLLGLRSATAIVRLLYYYLSMTRQNVHMVQPSMSGVQEQLVRAREGDVCVGISFPRYSRETVEGMRFAKRRGARVIAITDGATSPLLPVADFALTARSSMDSFVDSLVAPLSLVNALIVGVSLCKQDELKEYFALLEGVYDERETYTLR